MTQRNSIAMFVVLSASLHSVLLLMLNRQAVRMPRATVAPSIISARLVSPQIIEFTPDAMAPQALTGGSANNSGFDPDGSASAVNSKPADSGVGDVESPQPAADDRSEPIDSHQISTKPMKPKPKQLSLSAQQLRAMSQGFIANQQQQLVAELNNQNRQYGYGAKVSMSDLVKKPPVHQYIKTEIAVAERRKIKIYCESTINKITAITAALMGGTIECESLPELKQFIDDRRLRRPVKLE